MRKMPDSECRKGILWDSWPMFFKKEKGHEKQKGSLLYILKTKEI